MWYSGKSTAPGVKGRGEPSSYEPAGLESEIGAARGKLRRRRFGFHAQPAQHGD